MSFRRQRLWLPGGVMTPFQHIDRRTIDQSTPRPPGKGRTG
jgi:hypothetical protein